MQQDQWSAGPGLIKRQFHAIAADEAKTFHIAVDPRPSFCQVQQQVAAADGVASVVLVPGVQQTESVALSRMSASPLTT